MSKIIFNFAPLSPIGGLLESLISSLILIPINMKRKTLLLFFCSLLCASCSPVLFQQIATLSSENVEMKDNGSFAYEDAMVTIEYDFWSEAGKFYFIITNNTDDNLYLNLGESYFVNNGYAHDYYQSRTYVYTSRNTVTSSATASASIAGYASVGASTNVATMFGNIINIGAGLGASKGYGASNSKALASEKGVSVEYSEQPLVCIPSHSSKSFEEFNVSSSVFRECGFVRDPSRKETAVREYTENNSPRVIENRLVFQLGDVTLPVTNIFYVSEYQNIAYENATEYVMVENGNGRKYDVEVHKMSANNKYYITYSKRDMVSPLGKDNDRIPSYVDTPDRSATKAFKSREKDFSDGVYRQR